MTTFVSECRKEWHRLGVPTAVANEMATDLEADLAEAESDGVSPEEVLGNGYFDPTSFAAAWAAAKGVVGHDARADRPTRRRPVALVVGTAASAVVLLLGVALLVGRRHSSMAFAGVSVRRGFLPGLPPLRSVIVTPHQLIATQQGAAMAVVGLALVVVGLLGLATMLWLRRPGRLPKRRADGERDVGMPSFL